MSESLIPCVIKSGQLWRAEKNYHAGDPVSVTQATIDQHGWVFEKATDREKRLKASRVTLLTLGADRAKACGVVPAGDGIERYEVVRLDPGIERRDVLEARLAEIEFLNASDMRAKQANPDKAAPAAPAEEQKAPAPEAPAVQPSEQPQRQQGRRQS